MSHSLQLSALIAPPPRRLFQVTINDLKRHIGDDSLISNRHGLHVSELLVIGVAQPCFIGGLVHLDALENFLLLALVAEAPGQSTLF